MSEILGTPDLSSQSANVKGFISKIVDSLEDHGTLGCHCSTFANNHASRFLKSDDIQVSHNFGVNFAFSFIFIFVIAFRKESNGDSHRWRHMLNTCIH